MSDRAKFFVSVDKDLMKYKSVFTDTRPCSFAKSLLQPSIRGIFQGYNAEFGITYHHPMTDVSLLYTIFYRIKLKNRFKVPLFLWNQCHVTPYDNVDLCYGKWLTKSEDFYKLSNIGTIGEDIIGSYFRELVEVAHKLESGDITLADSISLQKKKFVKDLLMIPIGIIIFVVLIIICWLLYGVKR